MASLKKESAPSTAPVLKRLKCCAPGCRNKVPGLPDARGNPITFHRFPRHNENILNRWSAFCDNPSDTQFPYDDSRVCSAHFAVDLFRTFVRDGRLMRALHPEAVPNKTFDKTQLIPTKPQCVVEGCPTVRPVFPFPENKSYAL